MSLSIDKYNKDVVPVLKKELGTKSAMRIPTIKKIVVNACMSEAVQNSKVVNTAIEQITAIAGQRAVPTKAKKAIANFKLREGMPLGARVTLRRENMWSFFDKLVHLALPQVRDFRGLSPKGFDGRGNYNMGIKEQIIFPEISYDKVDKVRGMNITICTSADNDSEARSLLTHLGMPFKNR